MDKSVEDIKNIAKLFAIEGEFSGVEEIETGLINSTYAVTFTKESKEQTRYIIQRINESVFGDPHVVMKNVAKVTRHINERVLRIKKDFGGHTLSLYPDREGKPYVEGPGGGVWRCYNYIEGCRTYDVVENTHQAYEAARAFGAFQHLVSGLDPSEIKEVLPDFHNTPQRLEHLRNTVGEDRVGRVSQVSKELAEIEAMSSDVSRIQDLLVSGKLPLRVTHNDTKINNVLFDIESDDAICVIDLDTVMPGVALYDFGDLVRTATNPAEEDERDLSLVKMRMSIFEALVSGYLETAHGVLVEDELELLPFSGRLISLELGMRFLTDFLNGDQYFKVKREGQNLDRARTQIRLAQEIQRQEKEMLSFVHKIAKGLG